MVQGGNSSNQVASSFKLDSNVDDSDGEAKVKSPINSRHPNDPRRLKPGFPQPHHDIGSLIGHQFTEGSMGNQGLDIGNHNVGPKDPYKTIAGGRKPVETSPRVDLTTTSSRLGFFPPEETTLVLLIHLRGGSFFSVNLSFTPNRFFPFWFESCL